MVEGEESSETLAPETRPLLFAGGGPSINLFSSP
jgi:hypothetical protein